MPTPSRNAIYDATIRRMTACALEEAENRFAVEHAQDTEQQLADYLRKYADELGHTPWPREIPGGVTIQTRFGSWEAAVAEAGLPFPEHPNQPGKFRRVREETQRQRAIYRQKKAEKRERAKERMKAQEEKRRKRQKILFILLPIRFYCGKISLNQYFQTFDTEIKPRDAPTESGGS